MTKQSNFRLLVVRLGAMGDILHALPAVTALRQAHPDWTIDWVVEPHWSELLTEDAHAGHICQPLSPQPIVDHLLYAATKQWRKKPFGGKTFEQISALRNSLRRGEYDAVLDLQGSIRSAVIGRITSCRRRVGEAEPRERQARWFFTERIRTTGAHVIEQGAELASAIAGENLQPVRPNLPFHLHASAYAAELLSQDGPPAVLINPGAGWGAKRWPIERYADVARRLSAQGYKIVVNVGPGEEPMAEPIVRDCGSAAVIFSGSVAQLIAVTRRVRLAIAGDTGPLHLACALGVPVVGIYGPTDPSRNGPYGVPFRVLRSPESRRDHTRRAEPEAGLLTIATEDVLAAAHALLYPEPS